MKISRDISIEDLVTLKIEAISYLSKKGVRCIACGEPIWGTLEEAAKDKGYSDEEISTFVKELNEL
ncbi:MAG: hypothetical protein R3356_08350 [Eudoraea sp.]|nr:hypothetical protein [Eudoraea sp.]